MGLWFWLCAILTGFHLTVRFKISCFYLFFISALYSKSIQYWIMSKISDHYMDFFYFHCISKSLFTFDLVHSRHQSEFDKRKDKKKIKFDKSFKWKLRAPNTLYSSLSWLLFSHDKWNRELVKITCSNDFVEVDETLTNKTLCDVLTFFYAIAAMMFQYRCANIILWWLF